MAIYNGWQVIREVVIPVMNDIINNDISEHFEKATEILYECPLEFQDLATNKSKNYRKAKELIDLLKKHKKPVNRNLISYLKYVFYKVTQKPVNVSSISYLLEGYLESKEDSVYALNLAKKMSEIEGRANSLKNLDENLKISDDNLKIIKSYKPLFKDISVIIRHYAEIGITPLKKYLLEENTIPDVVTEDGRVISSEEVTDISNKILFEEILSIGAKKRIIKKITEF